MKITGVGTRALNFIIDTGILFIVSILLFNIWNWYVRNYGFGYHNFWVIFATLTLIYYIFFEGIFSRTPGKFFTFSKVVTSKGTKPGILVILLRTLVRFTLIDGFFIPFLDKTLHDYICKTEVVEV
ncbi:RDD family protein [Chitinophagaceae bacterium LWZ2-11]